MSTVNAEFPTTKLSGRAITPAPHYLIGAVENPGAPPFAYRVRRAAMKARAGARFGLHLSIYPGPFFQSKRSHMLLLLGDLAFKFKFFESDDRGILH